jgi:hypothetical protein
VPRAASLLLLLPLLTACGQTTSTSDVARPAPAAAAPADPAALLAGLPAAAEAAGSVRYDSVTEGALDGEPAEVDGRLSGVLDLATGAGTGELHLPALDELAAEADAAGEPSAGADLGAIASLVLSWTPTELTAVVDGERSTAPRDAEDSAIVARVPAEPAGLLGAVAAATDVVVVAQEDVDGVRTTHLTGTVEPQAAVDAGLGTQAQLSIADLPSLPVEVWVDDEGRPARIRYVAEVPSLQQGRTRTMTTTYDYRGWGEPVDVTP